VRHSSDRPTTSDDPLRPSRRGPRGLVAYSSPMLAPSSLRASSASDPKISEGGNLLCTLPRSSRVLVFLPEDKRRREFLVFTPDVGFNVLTATSSQTFGEQTEGGVPNNHLPCCYNIQSPASATSPESSFVRNNVIIQNNQYMCLTWTLC